MNEHLRNLIRYLAQDIIRKRENNIDREAELTRLHAIYNSLSPDEEQEVLGIISDLESIYRNSRSLPDLENIYRNSRSLHQGSTREERNRLAEDTLRQLQQREISVQEAVRRGATDAMRRDGSYPYSDSVSPEEDEPKQQPIQEFGKKERIRNEVLILKTISTLKKSVSGIKEEMASIRETFTKLEKQYDDLVEKLEASKNEESQDERKLEL